MKLDHKSENVDLQSTFTPISLEATSSTATTLKKTLTSATLSSLKLARFGMNYLLI